MVQLKYYGDDRDYFKYDLISFILEKSAFKQYGFVPMLTEYRYDNEGTIAPTPSECKSKELLNFICTHSKPDLNNWGLWLNQYVDSYITVQPANSTYFNYISRSDYWFKFQTVISAQNSLIFFDPDTGIQAGRKTRIDKKDNEKYILNNEMRDLLKQLSSSSMFVIYQHLQRNSNKHESDIRNKHDSLLKIDEALKIAFYREKDLAFMFIAKNDSIYKSLINALSVYKHRSTVSPRDLF